MIVIFYQLYQQILLLMQKKKSCPQIFLEECKYVVRKKKITNTINEELHLDEFNDESDNDKFNEYDED